MKIDRPGRDTLKSYFVKNAVPTASNFEDLIGAGLNQRDDGIARLRGVRFNWRDRPPGETPSIGLIAQEVEAVYPEAVSIGPDGMKGINYSLLVAPLIEAVKHQQLQINAMASRLAALEVGH